MNIRNLPHQTRLNQPLALLVALLLALAGVMNNVGAASGTWTNTISGIWSDPLSWDPNVVPGTAAGDVASLTNDITNNIVVTLDTPATLGTLNLGDTNNGNTYTLALDGINGSLTFNNSGSGAKLNQLATSRGDTVSAAMTLADNLTVGNQCTNPAFNLTLSGAIAGDAKKITINSTGAGAVAFNAASTFSGGMDVLAGNVTFNASLPASWAPARSP
jgi:autotransporter-associated beta strand protein